MINEPAKEPDGDDGGVGTDTLNGDAKVVVALLFGGNATPRDGTNGADDMERREVVDVEDDEEGEDEEDRTGTGIVVDGASDGGNEGEDEGDKDSEPVFRDCKFLGFGTNGFIEAEDGIGNL
ncbi:hypothetical protein FACS1894152_0140 [Bacilli bacterium]|nr:hypothetical protein FACS1894152_0140 [Bacilli bacterium]